MRNNERLFEFLGLVLLIIVAWMLVATLIKMLRALFGFVTVYSFQKGLLYSSGKLTRVLEPGRYFIFKPTQTVTVMDMRESVANIVNQEIICADNLAIRLSSSVIYRVVDAQKANEQAKSFLEILYLDVQLAMREVVAGLKIEEVLLKRNELSQQFLELLKPRAAAIGLEVDQGGIRDITFPADVKKIFTQVAQAEKAAQANLAKSRSETASLRALANAAKMMEGNPSLATLRTLQSVSELANSSGNTIVFGVPSPMVPIQNGPRKDPEPIEELDS